MCHSFGVSWKMKKGRSKPQKRYNNRNGRFALALLTIFAITLSTFSCHADDIDPFGICQDSSGKEGVKDERGEWVIPPVYDMISFNGSVYWVFVEVGADQSPLMGLIDPKRGVAIPAHYEEILLDDELIVAYDASTGFYDIFDSEWRLIYMLSGEYDYVVPNGANHVDVVDMDGAIHTIQIPRYLVSADLVD